MQSPKQLQLITVAEAARRKGVTRSAIYKAIAQGRLQAQQVLGKTALDSQAVELWQAKASPGWPRGKRVSDEAKRRISQTQKRRWAQRKQETQP